MRPPQRTRWTAALGTAALMGLGLGTAPIAIADGAGSAPGSLTAQTSVPGVLEAVDGTSHQDMWAVGELGDHGRQVQHFDGTSWTRVPLSGHAATVDVELRSVSAVTPTDAWAAG